MKITHSEISIWAESDGSLGMDEMFPCRISETDMDQGCFRFCEDGLSDLIEESL